MKKLFSRLLNKKKHKPTAPADYDGLSRQEAFSKVYRDRIWSRTTPDESPFHSGEGSRNPEVTGPYVAAISGFLQEFGSGKSVADIGCGDFEIGRQLVPFATRYMAFDIVPELIEHHRANETADHLSFDVLDLVEDPLPPADIILVRQVLQHLSNDDVLSFVRKFPGSCQHLIVTEHLPADENFVPNLEHDSGPGIRLSVNSGVDLSAAPFNLQASSKRILCDVLAYDGRIRTTLYSF
ncbi:class I SAM-dependent methyltransferase [Phaeobacter marinintestinus]|uniref:class I SAM-dependent methyltransferase n=1 Tax=Falsiphaeobacter marinintestinus TaxID=1492905 RepID=UPI0011B45D33|nr:class I SAM-dependent methyltransferase [Phaeobacter marinintestinus]